MQFEIAGSSLLPLAIQRSTVSPDCESAMHLGQIGGCPRLSLAGALLVLPMIRVMLLPMTSILDHPRLIAYHDSCKHCSKH